MKILALELSSRQRSVAVLMAPAGGALAAAEVVETGADAMRPLAMVDRALREAKLEHEQIDCVAVGLGPGSYTGIRAAISIAQGWQLARGIRLIGVSSADAIAARTQAGGFAGRASVVIDAQREEVYLADYDIGPDSFHLVVPLRLASLAEAQARHEAGARLVGPEVTRWFPGDNVVFPSASAICLLASGRKDFVAGETLEPIYLREANFVKAPPPRVFFP